MIITATLSLLMGLTPLDDRQCREAYEKTPGVSAVTPLTEVSKHPLFAALLEGAVIVESEEEGGYEPRASFTLAIPARSQPPLSFPLPLEAPWSGTVTVNVKRPSGVWCTQLTITGEGEGQEAVLSVPPKTTVRTVVTEKGKSRLDLTLPVYGLGFAVFEKYTPLLIQPNQPPPKGVSLPPGESVLVPVQEGGPATLRQTCVSLVRLSSGFGKYLEDSRCDELLRAAIKASVEERLAAAEPPLKEAGPQCTPPREDGTELCVRYMEERGFPGVWRLSSSGKLAQGSTVRLKVDEQLVGTGPAPSLSIPWNSCPAPGGARALKAEGLDAQGRVTHTVERELEVAHPQQPPLLRATPADSAVLLEWEGCGDARQAELYFSPTPEVGAGSKLLAKATSRYLHRVPKGGARHFYRLAVRRGEQLLWSNTVEMGPSARVCSAEGWCSDYPRPFLASGSSSVWGTAPDKLWVAAQWGLFGWDGKQWSWTYVREVMLHLSGSSERDVWAVGAGGIAYHWNGQAWSPVPVPVKETLTGIKATLHGVWVHSPSEAWAVGDEGTILRWNGTAWSAQASPVSKTLKAVWGTGPGKVWAVGDGGTALRWDGTVWKQVPTGADKTLTALWGTGEKDLWAVGQQGTIVWWNGEHFSPIASPIKTDFVRVWGRSTTEVWALASGGAGVLGWDGAQWKVRFSSGPPWGRRANADDAIRSPSPDERWAFYDVALGLGGKRWSPEPPERRFGDINDLAVLPDGTAWAVGDKWTALFWNGTAWEDHSVRTSSILDPKVYLQAVWAAGPRQVWAADSEGHVLQGDGTTWRFVRVGGEETRIRDLWGAGPNAIWAAGSEGVYFWNGSSWALQHPTKELIQGVSGTHGKNVWAVGEKGQAYRWDGAAWKAVPTGATDSLRKVSVTGQEVWALSVSSVVFQWVNGGWRRHELPGAEWTTGLLVRGPKDVWVSAGNGSVWRWNGTTWSRSFGLLRGLEDTVLERSGRKVWLTFGREIYVRELPE